MDIEPIAVDRYRLRAHNQVITVSAQDLCELADWCRLHNEQLEQKAKSSLHAEAEAKGWPVEDEEERLHLLISQGMAVRLQKLAINASDEPLLEDCKWCGQAHDARFMDQCPLNPANKPIAADQAMEAALQMLAGQILSLRTELLFIKAEIMKQDRQEYEDTRKYMEHHYEGGE